MSESHIPDSLSVAPSIPDRNLALELVRVTEAAAMAAISTVSQGSVVRSYFMTRGQT